MNYLNIHASNRAHFISSQFYIWISNGFEIGWQTKNAKDDACKRKNRHNKIKKNYNKSIAELVLTGTYRWFELLIWLMHSKFHWFPLMTYSMLCTGVFFYYLRLSLCWNVGKHARLLNSVNFDSFNRYTTLKTGTIPVKIHCIFEIQAKSVHIIDSPGAQWFFYLTFEAVIGANSSQIQDKEKYTQYKSLLNFFREEQRIAQSEWRKMVIKVPRLWNDWWRLYLSLMMIWG